MQVEQLTCAIGAELIGVNLADAVHDDGLFAAIREQLLKHRVLFLRNQDFSRAEHVAFARRFGELFVQPNYRGTSDDDEVLEIRRQPTHLTLRVVVVQGHLVHRHGQRALGQRAGRTGQGRVVGEQRQLHLGRLQQYLACENPRL